MDRRVSPCRSAILSHFPRRFCSFEITTVRCATKRMSVGCLHRPCLTLIELQWRSRKFIVTCSARGRRRRRSSTQRNFSEQRVQLCSALQGQNTSAPFHSRVSEPLTVLDKQRKCHTVAGSTDCL